MVLAEKSALLELTDHVHRNWPGATLAKQTILNKLRKLLEEQKYFASKQNAKKTSIFHSKLEHFKTKLLSTFEAGLENIGGGNRVSERSIEKFKKNLLPKKDTENKKIQTKCLTEETLSEVDTEPDDDDDDGDYIPPLNPTKKFRIDHEVTMSLDRASVSNSNSSDIIESITKKASPKSTVAYNRRKHRRQIYEDVKNNFSPSPPLILHSDGKRLKALDSNAVRERLATMVVDCEGNEQVLGAPLLRDGKGKTVAEATFKLLEEWQIADRIK